MTTIRGTLVAIFHWSVAGGPADLGYLEDWGAARVRAAAAYTATLYEGIRASSHGRARRADVHTLTLLETRRREAHIATLRHDRAAVADRERRIQNRSRVAV